jgi:hypothetical protein
MRRSAFVTAGAMVACILAATPATARLKKDVVPDADAAKRIARSILESSMSAEGYENYWSHKILTAELKHNTWIVGFHETDPLAPEPIAGPGEIIISVDSGGYAEVRLSKHNAKVHSIRFSR